MSKGDSSKEEGDKHELVVGGSLSEVPIKSSRPLDEMVERSLVSIRTGKQLSTMHQIGEYELCDPDYQLVCAWAEQTGKSNEEVLKDLLEGDSEGDISVIEEGRFLHLSVEANKLPITSLPDIGGLVIDILILESVKTLTELDLSVVPNLEGLYCSSNKLTELDLSVVPNLYMLSCSENHLTELDLSVVPNLTRLICDENHLTELDLSFVPNLTRLICDENNLTELDLSFVPNLTTLSCSENHLTELDLSVVPNLTKLICDETDLTELDLSFVPNLTNLWCNDLTELDIRPLQHLEHLSYDKDKTRLIKRDDQKF